MSDVYRTAALICPACASPMREFADRLVCDHCEGILLGLEDLRAACSDIAGSDLDVELFDLEESKAACPRCQRPLATCRLRVGSTKIRARVRGDFASCVQDGVWLGRGGLAGVLAAAGRKWAHPRQSFDAAGAHTRRVFQPRSGGSATDGLTIARWRNRPRKRAQTLTPINAYADRTLRCPVCADRDLVFLADRYACEQCRGVFVQVAALETLVAEMIDAPWEMPPAAGVAGARGCPVCVAPMTVETVEGVTIDRCTHGVWFDPTELEALLVREGDQPTGVVAWLRRLF